MRNIDALGLSALNGSRVGDRITCHAWYGGRLVASNLKVTDWSMDWDDTAQIKGAISITVLDDSNRLTPWLLSDPLGVGGAEIQVIYTIGGTIGGHSPTPVNVAWFRIVKNAPDEQWRSYVIKNNGVVNVSSVIPNGYTLTMVPGGSKIVVNGHDRTENAVNGRLFAPESPAAGGTVTSEVARLLKDLMRVTVAAGVVDAHVSANTIYARDRMNEVENLLALIQCGHRMTGDGALEIYPLAKAAPVWTIAGGPQGVLIKINHGTEIAGLYNAVISDGTATVNNPDGTTSQVPVRGVAQITEGDLSVNGPHHPFPYFHSSQFITTQRQANDDAANQLATLVTAQTIDFPIECAPNPALQTGDWVTIYSPVIDGRQVPVVARVLKMGLKGSSATVGRMTLTIRLSYQDAQTIIRGVNRATS